MKRDNTENIDYPNFADGLNNLLILIKFLLAILT